LRFLPGIFWRCSVSTVPAKTSALEVLEGLAAPSDGTVRVLGHDPRRERAVVRRHMGVLLQESGLAGDLTVRSR
jgi:ABC-2 type transport system ATP-binding protein